LSPFFIYNAWKKSRRVGQSHFSGTGNKPPINRKMFVMTESNEQLMNPPCVAVEAVAL